MVKEKIGVWLVTGLIGVTGLVSSGYLGDPNKLLEPFKAATTSSETVDTAPQEPQKLLDQEVSDTQIAPTENEPSAESADVAMGNSDDSALDNNENAIADGKSAAIPEAESEAKDEELSVESTPVIYAPEQAAVETKEAAQTDNQTAMVAEPEVESIVPTFDILRVEPNGDMVIAGIAAGNADVEIVAGSKTLAIAKSNNRGEFVAILDEPLATGDYEIVLRATQEDGGVATSLETAIVSIPDAGSNDVLALVEAPGEPSRLITKTEETGGSKQVVEAPAENVDAAAKETAVEELAVTKTENPPQSDAKQETGELVRIEAVEIDGEKIFVAGATDAGARIRVYANEIALGEDIANDEGRFLVEANRALPVGDYLIRADRLSKNGQEVVSRAAVPFARTDGAKLAAVAVPQAPALPETPPLDSATDLGNEGAEKTAINEDTKTASVAQTDPDDAEMVPLNSTAVETPDDDVESAEPTTMAATPDALEPTGNVNERLQPVDSSVIIRRGDTLWQISRRVYGRGIKYTTIYLANEDQIKDPDRIWPGQIFALPEKADDVAN